MKAALKSLLLMSLMLACTAGMAASRSATIQVSFTVVESCSVQTAAQQASVRCELSTPYSISQAAPAQPALAAQSAVSSDAKVVTITF